MRQEPIGIGEILGRVIGKTVSKFLNADVCEAVGVRQTCTGQEGGIEAAIHAATILASADCTLQKVASNAFNNMNRELSLHNAQFVCPKIHR